MAQRNVWGKERKSGSWMSGETARQGRVPKPGMRQLILMRDDYTCQRVVREVRGPGGTLVDYAICGRRLQTEYLDWRAGRSESTCAPLQAGHIENFEANGARGLNWQYDAGQGMAGWQDRPEQTAADLYAAGFDTAYVAWVMSQDYEPSWDIDCMHAECSACNNLYKMHRNPKDVVLRQMDRARRLNDELGLRRIYQRVRQRSWNGRKGKGA